MKRVVSFLMLALCVIPLANAQSGERPGWVDHKPKASNSTYIYVVERAGGKRVTEAVNKALLKVFQNTMMRIGVVVDWKEINDALQKGDYWGNITAKFNIPVYKVCEYVESKSESGYRVAILCQVAVRGDVAPQFDDFNACNDTRTYNDWVAVVESALLPGLGQMSKRHYGSGIFTLVGEVVLVGGAVVTNHMAQEELNTMKQPDVTFNKFSSARKNYDNLRTANIACVSAAAVLYAVNLVRAGTMTPKYKNNRLSFTPTLMPVDEKLGTGVNLTYKF